MTTEKKLFANLPENLQPTTPDTDVFGKVVTFTPEQAQYILEHFNPSTNREQRLNNIRQYATSIKTGRWELNGEPLIFSKDGHLLDGQHRLFACVQAGMPLTTFCVFNISPKTFGSMDTGSNRSVANAFQTEGIRNYKIAANIVSKVMSMRKGYAPITAEGNQNLTHNTDGNRNLLSIDEYKRFEKSYEEITKYAMCHRRQTDKISKDIYSRLQLSTADVGSIIFRLHNDLGHNLELCKAFMEELYDASKASKLMSSLAQFLANDKLSQLRMKPRQIQKCIAKAWNLYAVGKTKVKFDGKDPEIYDLSTPAHFLSVQELKETA